MDEWVGGKQRRGNEGQAGDGKDFENEQGRGDIGRGRQFGNELEDGGGGERLSSNTTKHDVFVRGKQTFTYS